MANRPDGFTYELVRGDVVISHHGRWAVTLRGAAVQQFLADVEHEPQQLIARITGNYKRGSERVAKEHPRNQRH